MRERQVQIIVIDGNSGLEDGARHHFPTSEVKMQILFKEACRDAF